MSRWAGSMNWWSRPTARLWASARASWSRVVSFSGDIEVSLRFLERERRMGVKCGHRTSHFQPRAACYDLSGNTIT